MNDHVRGPSTTSRVLAKLVFHSMLRGVLPLLMFGFVLIIQAYTPLLREVIMSVIGLALLSLFMSGTWLSKKLAPSGFFEHWGSPEFGWLFVGGVIWHALLSYLIGFALLLAGAIVAHTAGTTDSARVNMSTLAMGLMVLIIMAGFWITGHRLLWVVAEVKSVDYLPNESVSRVMFPGCPGRRPTPSATLTLSAGTTALALCMLIVGAPKSQPAAPLDVNSAEAPQALPVPALTSSPPESISHIMNGAQSPVAVRARLAALSADARQRIREIQPKADRFLIEQPQLEYQPPMRGDHNPMDSKPLPKMSARLQRVVWDNSDAILAWNRLRSLHDVDGQFASLERELLALEQRVHQVVQAPTAADATEVVQLIAAQMAALDALQQDLASDICRVAASIRERDSFYAGVELVPGYDPRSLTSFIRDLGGEEAVAEVLEKDVALRQRHRYAMARRPYLRAIPEKSPWTWPAIYLFSAATDFNFWYEWATNSTWYEGTYSLVELRPQDSLDFSPEPPCPMRVVVGKNLWLDPAEWPRDAEKTRALHKEFCGIVYFEHSLAHAQIARRPDLQRKSLHITPKELKEWTFHWQSGTTTSDIRHRRASISDKSLEYASGYVAYLASCFLVPWEAEQLRPDGPPRLPPPLADNGREEP